MRAATLIVVLAAFCCPWCFGATVEQVLEAWQAREANADVAFVQIETTSLTSLTGSFPFGVRSDRSRDNSTTSTQFKQAITLHGLRIRDEGTGTIPNLEGPTHQMEVVEVFDGVTTQTATTFKLAEGERLQGLVTQENTTNFMIDIRFLPLHYCLRPISLGLGGDKSQIKNIENIETDSGTLTRLTLRDHSVDVDPQAGFSVVAIRSNRGSWSQEITYKETAEDQWVPTGWVMASGYSVAAISRRTEVINFKTNMQLSPDTFTVSFRSGTEVVVADKNHEHEETFIADSEGKLVPSVGSD